MRTMPPGLGQIDTFLLEEWFRERYFTVDIDISCSGVAPYDLGELRRIVGASVGDLDNVIFRDSPSAGGERLRAAIENRFLPAGASGQAMITNGSTEALFFALTAIIRPGDEVVVLGPSYQSYAAVARALGATVRVWPLRPEHDFEPDVDDLRAVTGPATRAVVVNFPHNPTGVMPGPAAYRALLDHVASLGCFLCSDEAFGELVYDGCWPSEHLAYERCLMFGTMSKAYGLPGLRVGWCVAPGAIIREMVRLRDHVSIGTSPLNELLAALVLEHADRVVGPRKAAARKNLDLLRDWASGHPGLVQLPLPAGGVTAFPRFPRWPDVYAACEELARAHRVLVVPGNCFDCPDRMRIGFGGPAADLLKGLDLITSVLGSSAPSTIL